MNYSIFQRFYNSARLPRPERRRKLSSITKVNSEDDRDRMTSDNSLKEGAPCVGRYQRHQIDRSSALMVALQLNRRRSKFCVSGDWVEHMQQNARSNDVNDVLPEPGEVHGICDDRRPGWLKVETILVEVRESCRGQRVVEAGCLQENANFSVVEYAVPIVVIFLRAASRLSLKSSTLTYVGR